MIKAVFFDLDDTLYPYAELDIAARRQLYAAVSRKYGIAASEAKTAYERGRAAINAQLSGTASSHNRLLYCQRMLECLGRNPITDALAFYNAYWDYMLDNMRLRPGVIETVSELKRRGLKIGICTDLTAHIQHRKLARLGLAGYVDYLVTSEEAGTEKPDPRVFALCAEKSGVKRDEILFVGDSYEKDYLGAKAAGMAARLLAANGKAIDGAETTEQISAISEILGNTA